MAEETTRELILQSIREIYAREAVTNVLNAMTPVYFACSGCALIYRTIQVRRSKPKPGRIDCVDCKATVHDWSGLYDFVNWKPVRPAQSDAGFANPQTPK